MTPIVVMLLTGVAVASLLAALLPTMQRSTSAPRRVGALSKAMSASMSSTNQTRAVCGVAGGVVAFVLTGWPVAALAVVLLVVAWPQLSAGSSVTGGLDRLEAIATWTESLRDLTAGGTGLAEALTASTSSAHPSLQVPLMRLDQRLDDAESLPVALSALADDLDDPAGSMVVAALAMNARAHGPQLSAALGRLAKSIRSDVELRRRLEAARRGDRRVAKIIASMALGMVMLTRLLPEQLTRPYNALGGQLVLLGVMGMFAFGFWIIRRTSDLGVADNYLSDKSEARR